MELITRFNNVSFADIDKAFKNTKMKMLECVRDTAQNESAFPFKVSDGKIVITEDVLAIVFDALDYQMYGVFQRIAADVVLDMLVPDVTKVDDKVAAWLEGCGAIDAEGNVKVMRDDVR